jgi:hypothetical protein
VLVDETDQRILTYLIKQDWPVTTEMVAKDLRVTFYDANGKVVYVDFTFTSPSDVPPASKYGFKMTVSSDERTNQIARYSLIAESQNYTSVPELSAPMLVAGIVLSMGVLAAWKKRHDFT